MTRSGYAILGAVASPSSDGGADGAVALRMGMTDAEARASALAYLHSLVGTDYIWASKDPAKGLDCSGAVAVAYEHAGLAKPGARYRYGSADLHRVLRPTSNPKAGDAVFYGKNGDVSHVMLVVGDGRVLGSTGGGRSTRTSEDARAIGAGVKYKPVDYRKDLVSYGSAPSVAAPLDGSSSARLDTSDSRAERAERIGYGVLFGTFTTLGAWIAWWLRRRAAQ